MTITPQWKDELRARITLSSVIMRTTKLTKAGREWKGCCPFHDEKTPSFYVNDQKQFYHCFGCSAHGDVISWMTEQRGLSFMDAVKELAAEAGMEVPAPDPVAAKKAEKRASLVDVTTAAQEWYVQNLNSAEGRSALDYLRNRGLSEETVREFGFGFAPESKQALPTALPNFDEAMLVESGMRIETDDGTKYDRFRGRVMLPIQDARGRVIAFGGRILDKREGVAKYLNSPDTPLFDKGRTLYNLHRAAPASRQTGRVIVVEGYMDVVALAQAGISDAVAPLGTALTEMQLEMLWRLTDEIVLLFDGDKAGRKAAERVLDRALPKMATHQKLSFALLPDGLDPDDLIQRFGAKSLLDIIDGRATLEEFIWDTEAQKTDFSSVQESAMLRQRLDERALSFTDRILRTEFQYALKRKYFAKVHPQMKFSRSTDHGQIDASSRTRLQHFLKDGSRFALVKALIIAMARHPTLRRKYFVKLGKYKPMEGDVLYAVNLFLWAAEAELDQGIGPDEEIHRLANEKSSLPFPFLSEDATADFADPYLSEGFTMLVDIPEIELAIESARKVFEDEPDEHNQTVLLSRMQRLSELRSSIGHAWRETV